MKTFLLTTGLLVIALVKLTAQDLPGPSSNLQTLPNGSYVIPMDNTLQTDNSIGAGNFNLKAYGLIVHLLNNNVKLKWVIKAGKAKDGIDFTGTAEQLRPSLVSGGVSRNFISGPFVVFAADTTGLAALIDGFYTAQSLTGNSRPKVFRLTADAANVDIRYDLTAFKPKAAILTDGGNQAVHVGYMTAAGVTTTNYSLGIGSDLLAKCFTFASEPHNDSTGVMVNTTISAIKAFVQNGGNFLAQCAAIVNYENNALGRFQTTSGITTANANIGTTVSFPNADLSFSQIQGDYDANKNGSVRNWTMTTGTNNEHNHATGTGANASVVAASVSKLKTGNGGLVFYIGNHEFSSNSITGINGIRMYMNAFLTPVSINNNCSIAQLLINPLPVKLLYFNAFPDTKSNKIDLKWSTSSEINASHFVIERSTDGVHFNDKGTVFASGNSVEQNNYVFTDNVSLAGNTIVYYRLRQVDRDGKFEYSPVRIVRTEQQTEKAILTYPNPVVNELNISVSAEWQNKKLVYEIFNSNGQLEKSSQLPTEGLVQKVNMSRFAPGIYIIRMKCGNDIAMAKVIKQ